MKVQGSGFSNLGDGFVVFGAELRVCNSKFKLEPTGIGVRVGYSGQGIALVFQVQELGCKV